MIIYVEPGLFVIFTKIRWTNIQVCHAPMRVKSPNNFTKIFDSFFCFVYEAGTLLDMKR